jgi:hypothetical protein
VTAPLSYIDSQMADYADALKAIGIDDPAVASKVYDEITALSGDAHDRIRANMRFPPERFRDELAAFQRFETVVASQRGTLDRSVRRARTIVMLYICFVMLRDSLLGAVGEACAEADSDSVTTRIVTFLRTDELRLFRNSIAHGDWDYEKGGLVYSASPNRDEPVREYRVDEATFDFWQRLSRAASYAVVLALTVGRDGRGRSSGGVDDQGCLLACYPGEDDGRLLAVAGLPPDLERAA